MTPASIDNVLKSFRSWPMQGQGHLNNPDKLKALKDAGLSVVERIPIEVITDEPAAHYLRTKKEKLGHLLDHAD